MFANDDESEEEERWEIEEIAEDETEELLFWRANGEAA